MKKLLIGLTILGSMSSFAGDDLTKLVCVGQNTMVKFTSYDHPQYKNEAITQYGDGNNTWSSFIYPILEDKLDDASNVRTLTRRNSNGDIDLFKLSFDKETGKGQIVFQDFHKKYEEEVRCIERIKVSESYR
jgi:hypothetical protein